jgi:hypothetical protein
MARQFSISVRAHSTGSRSALYRLLADSSTWSTWTPFSDVTLIEEAPGGGEGVGAVKQTRFRALSGRERLVSMTPDRQLSYAYVGGVFRPDMHDYVAVVDLEDDAQGTSIHWHSTYYSRFAGSGRLPRRSLRAFLQKCADGLAATASSHPDR